jgi:hypothetical protein
MIKGHMPAFPCSSPFTTQGLTCHQFITIQLVSNAVSDAELDVTPRTVKWAYDAADLFIEEYNKLNTIPGNEDKK